MPEADSRLLAPASERSTQLLAWSVAVALPALGLVLLLATPAADVRWEHHPSHFWLALMVAWAALSLASIPPLDDPTPAERATGALIIPAAVALVFFAFAGGRYLVMAVRARSAILLAVASACILLAEAMVAVAFSRSWQLTWWEWHLLMLGAFGAIAVSARREESAERFSDLYLDHTSAGKREVSVLFADLAGFTAFSEGRDPREVSEMLNAYFGVAIPPIVRNTVARSTA